MKTLRLTLYFTGGVLLVLGFWAMTYPVEASLMLASPLLGGVSVAMLMGSIFVVSGFLILTEAHGIFT